MDTQVSSLSQETCQGYIALSAENRNHALDLGTISPSLFLSRYLPLYLFERA
jgi:hypothetical protein